MRPVPVRLHPLALLLVMISAACAADAYPVTALPGPLQVAIQYKGLPISLGLSHLEVPPEAQAAFQERLGRLVTGKRVEVVYTPDFGLDASGAARVQLVLDKTNINEALIAAGLARYQAAKPDSAHEQPLKRAQDKAQKAKLGIWAGTPAAPAAAPVAAKPPPAARPATPAARPTGPFCSELDSALYHPTGHPAVASVAAQRLIFYPDEGAAKRAGKKPAPPPTALPTGTDEATGDQVFAQGKEVYAAAIAKGNTSERDAVYEQAYVLLTRAMHIYSTLVEQRPDDEPLGEKLRACMQLRYGAVKQRRF